jgi:hypothetical protein
VLGVPGAGPAGVGERLVRERLPRKVLGGVPDQLVVLGEVAHGVQAELVDPVLHAEQRVAHRRARLAGPGRLRDPVPQAQQADDLEVGAVGLVREHLQ